MYLKTTAGGIESTFQDTNDTNEELPSFITKLHYAVISSCTHQFASLSYLPPIVNLISASGQ